MTDNNRLMQYLTWSFVAGVSGFLVLMVIGIVAPSTGLSPIVIVCLLVMVSAGFPFYICLGILAKQMGRSWITWVGMTFITKPIGPFVAYFKMRDLVNLETENTHLLQASKLATDGTELGTCCRQSDDSR
jgi:hypothetical protein